MKIQVHIERLVLKGLLLSTEQAQELRTVIETELSRRMTSWSDSLASYQSISLPNIRSGTLVFSATTSPRRFGARTAQRLNEVLLGNLHGTTERQSKPEPLKYCRDATNSARQSRELRPVETHPGQPAARSR